MSLTLLAGCSALRLSYNQGPTLAWFWLDGYADFNREQAPAVKGALADWFTWHRASQLPDYAQLLADMQALAVNKVTPTQVCKVLDAWEDRAERAFEQAVPALAEVVRTLTPEQITHIEKRMASKHADWLADHVQTDLAERQKASYERWLDQTENMYGRLDDAQRRQLATELAASSYDAQIHARERQQRQIDIIRALRQWQAERADSATVAAGLRRLAATMRHSPRADYRDYAERLMPANCAVVARLHNTTTTAQRQHAVDRLKGWEEDLRALAAQAR